MNNIKGILPVEMTAVPLSRTQYKCRMQLVIYVYVIVKQIRDYRLKVLLL